MQTESSSSAFIVSGNISNKWSEITCLQVRSRNVLYSGIRYGRKFLIKAVRDGFTNTKLQQEKEFRQGILLSHPNIMSTYSFEEVDDLGMCIVSEWIEGVTLGEWLKNKQNINARRKTTIIF